MRGSLHFINTLCIVISVSGVTGSSVVENLHYVGCYDLDYSLCQKYYHHIPSVTLTKCVQFCQVLKTRFAAVKARDNFCYCGGDIVEKSIKRNNTLCNFPCPDEPLRTCGGDWVMSLYDIQGASAVDFLLGTSTGVRLYHANNNSTFDTLMNTSDIVYSVNYHFSKNLIFFISDYKLFKTTLEPKRRTVSTPLNSQLIKNVSWCTGFAVDWVHDRVYWANCDGDRASIMACGLNGEAEQTVLPGAELNRTALHGMEIDPYKGIVFWTANRVIQSVETSGEEFNPNLTKSNMYAGELTLDLRRQRVYYVGITLAMKRSTSLYSMDYSGGEKVEHFTVPQFSHVFGLSILSDKVFWVNFENDRDDIYEAPLNLTRVEDVKMFGNISWPVWDMRVVHPDLQRRPKIDPCLDKGCAHSCVASGTTSAQCKCPSGQALHYDGVSCHVSGVTGSSVVDNLHYVGCYDPDYSLRQKYHHHIPSVTLTKCVQICQVLNTRFAAVEASDNFCYCGGDIGEESIKRNNTLCNIPCPDEPLRTCGGEQLMSLYDIQGASAVVLVNQYHRAAARMYFASIPMVLAVVLASLALVYLGDKYWSFLESKFFGVPYSRSRGREGEAEGGAGTTEYHTGEDNVNLI